MPEGAKDIRFNFVPDLDADAVLIHRRRFCSNDASQKIDSQQNELELNVKQIEIVEVEKEEEFQAPKYEETTLAKWGANVLMGVKRGSPPVLSKGFSFRNLTFEREREIDKMRNAKGGAGSHPGKTVTTVLAHMLTSWGGEDWTGKKMEHRENELNDSYMEDVLYAWIYLRAEQLDPVLKLKPVCAVQSCRHESKWHGDLRSMQATVTHGEIPCVEFPLSEPVEWGGEHYDSLRLMPPKWKAIASIPPNASEADVKASLVISSVHSLYDSVSKKETGMSSRALDLMPKRDIERLTLWVMKDVFPRVDAEFEIVCPKCKNKNNTSLIWTWDFFFGSSSM